MASTLQSYTGLCRSLSTFTYEPALYPSSNSPSPYLQYGSHFCTPTKVLNKNDAFSNWDEQGILAQAWSALVNLVFKGSSGFLEYVSINGHDSLPDGAEALLPKLEGFEKENLSPIQKGPGISHSEVEEEMSGFGYWVSSYDLLETPTVKIYHLNLSADGGFLVSLVVVHHLQS